MDCGRTLYVDGDDEKANFKEKFSRLAAITVVEGIPVEVNHLSEERKTHDFGDILDFREILDLGEIAGKKNVEDAF